MSPDSTVLALLFALVGAIVVTVTTQAVRYGRH